MFWAVFFLILFSLFILQSSVLSFAFKPIFVPYILWPPLLFFFLYKSWQSTFILLSFISVLSSVFLSLSIPVLFFIYLFFFAGTVIIKQFLFSKSFGFFVSLSLVFSFLFPYFIEGAYNFSKLNFSSSNFLFYFYKSILTCILAGCLFPVFKKYFLISKSV